MQIAVADFTHGALEDALQNELVNRMETHYTEQYTSDEINKIISAYDKDDDIYVVFSNRVYSKPKNGNRLNTDAFWKFRVFQRLEITTTRQVYS